jgi:fructose-bisphosphate aldolase, class II
VTLAPTGELVAAARRSGTAIAAFNVITVEHAEAIVAGAQRAGQPVILQISENAVRFHGDLGPIAAATRAVAVAATVPCALHLDHVTSMELVRQAPEHGFASVMFDTSTLPYAGNVAATREAVDFCRAHGLWLESELGTVGGKDGAAPLGAHEPGARTDPAQAQAYVLATGVDALAVAVGSSHAMTTRDAALDHDLIAALAGAVPVPLVLHGSSGVGDAELRRAVAGGLAKVNVGTALNIAFTGAVRQALDADPALVDPRRYLSAARAAMAATVAHFLATLASATPASIIGAAPAAALD